MDGVPVPRKDQRVSDRASLLLEDRHSTPDDGSIRFVDLLRGIEDRGKHREPSGSLDDREVDDAGLFPLDPASETTLARSWPSSSTSVSHASPVIGQRWLAEGCRIAGSFMVSDLLVVRTVAGSSRDAAGAAERKADMKDGAPVDLDFAGWLFGAQTAHQGTSL